MDREENSELETSGPAKPEKSLIQAEETADSGCGTEDVSPGTSPKPNRRAFLKRPTGILCLVLAALIAAAGAGLGGHALWYARQPKFQDCTVELGTQSVSLADFLTKYARAEKVRFVTDPATVNIDCVGDIELVLAQGRQEETVTLHVVDTTAPEVEFLTSIERDLSYVPSPEDFVLSIYDYSDTTVTFLEDVPTLDSYEDLCLTVAVTDESGNATTCAVTVCYTWLLDSYSMELGDPLTKENLLRNPTQGQEYISQEDLDEICASGVGVYDLESSNGTKTLHCEITVADTTPPVLTLQDVTVCLDQTASLDDFLVSAEDLSGNVTVRLVGSLPNGRAGTYTVTVEAEDIYGNITCADAVFRVKHDDIAPTFSGLSDLSLTRGDDPPDYLADVTAEDNIDETVSISWDDTSVDYDKAGIYYVTYTAEDSDGNVASAKRKVTVNHNAEDTEALVASVADSLGDDLESIWTYVRYSISYSSTYGGDDPVWYGLTCQTGNCYVHAVCMKAIFDCKGITSQLIWTTTKSHFWLIVLTDDGWKHIDATPASHRTTFKLMSDAERLADHLSTGWDFSKWPACH